MIYFKKIVFMQVITQLTIEGFLLVVVEVNTNPSAEYGKCTLDFF